jgi:uncharacterized repeat protein (TIGR03803 family)
MGTPIRSKLVGKNSPIFAVALAAAITFSSGTEAQTFRVVRSFNGSDGAFPLSGLTNYLGDLYGTASSGGTLGAGVVYKVTPSSGDLSVVYSFKGGVDGAVPQSGLAVFQGNLYGTTSAGGPFDAGTVFEITPGGKKTTLYSFMGLGDGAGPEAALSIDSVGNLYGTTFAGGAGGKGTVFKLVRPKTSGETWTEQVLHSFGKGKDGANPVAGVTFDETGNLYGTTSAGGVYGYGTVFQLIHSASLWTEHILHHFRLQYDGGVPYAGIVVDTSGKLYGAATDGGWGGSSGGGTAFEMTHASSGWVFKVIYSLSGWGISGSFRNLLLSSGKIYATTHCDGVDRAGTVYELTPSGNAWTYKQFHVFTGGRDGLFSFSNLVFDGEGNLWGTTKQGGASGLGVVFMVKP